MIQKTRVGADEIEAALNRQIQVADQVRSDMRQLVTASFSEAINPILDDAEKRIGRNINDVTMSINEFGSGIKESYAKLDSLHTDLLNIPEIMKPIIDNSLLQINEKEQQIEISIGKTIDLLECTQNEIRIGMTKIDADIIHLKTESLPGLEMQLASLSEIIKAINTDITKIVAENIDPSMNALVNKIDEIGKMLRNQRMLIWVVTLLYGSAISLLAWVAFRGM